jgi:hypothetical protein
VKPFIGSGTARPAPFGPIPLVGRLLVGSDGLFKYAPRARVVAGASRSSLEAAADALIAEVRLKSGRFQDDVALVLCQQGE